MPSIDEYELEVLSAYEQGKLKSVATKGELAKFKAAARATAIKDIVGSTSACRPEISRTYRSKRSKKVFHTKRS